jgi:hypothetical protein
LEGHLDYVLEVPSRLVLVHDVLNSREMANNPRVVVALPDAAERAKVADWLLAEQFEPVQLAKPRDPADGMRARPFDLLIADESFAFRDGLHATNRVRNPLTPTIVVGSEGDEPKGDDADGMTMYLARPVERAMLICFVSMALLEGRPERRSPRKLVSRFNAFANGVAVHLIDVSNEGLRIELPLEGRSDLAACFNLRVPLIGVTVSVKRIWTRALSNRGGLTWYGAALAENRRGAEEGWRRFVETIPAVNEAG